MGTIKSAMILAAGLGSRLRPITNIMPKSMVPVNGKSFIHRSIKKLTDHGVERIVINTHYLSDLLEEHIKTCPDFNKAEIIITKENKLYNTGGSVKNALGLLGTSPFFVLNSDVVWVEQGKNTALERLEHKWHAKPADITILVHKTEKAIGFAGTGDFNIDNQDRLYRLSPEEHMDYIYASMLITDYRYFTNSPEGAFCLFRFKYNTVFKEGGLMEKAYPVIHQGDWLHVNTPDALHEVELYLKSHHNLASENKL